MSYFGMELIQWIQQIQYNERYISNVDTDGLVL